MTISIWRYSHLTLAISSFIFILIAAITGSILALEPIQKKFKEYSFSNLEDTSVATTITALQKEYEEVISVEIDANNGIIADVVTKTGESASFYIHPKTGKNLGEIQKKAALYQFATTLHRSLFLKSTGRFMVTFFSFLLFLITITGIILLSKRQGGLKKFFSKTIKEETEPYYHVLLGKYTFIPILLITLSGIYISLDKFSILPKESHHHKIAEQPSVYKTIPVEKFEIFKNTPLSDVKRIEFPFSEDEEDYFTLKLHNKELLIHQYSGNLLSTHNSGINQQFLQWSFAIHTGNGSVVWSFVLFCSSIAILYFIYSGFVITFKRRKKSSLPKNIYHKNQAVYILLVGSESGSTFQFANTLFKALIEKKQKAYIDQLNNYSTYSKAKYLLILTATYGDGEPPVNATKFQDLLKRIPPLSPLNYAVVGFGSLAYKNYCKFATDLDTLLVNTPGFTQWLPLTKINNQSFDSFKNWVTTLNIQSNLQLNITPITNRPKKQHTFEVVQKNSPGIDDTFLLQLKTPKNITFQSGDLLSIYPEQDNIERLYSIARVDNTVLLSIKKHEYGICSQLLHSMELGNQLQATVKKNNSFHFPKKAKEVLLIANGTGIAPFLGMLYENTQQIKTHLFWGGRTKKSFSLYEDYLYKNLEKKQLYSFYTAFSRENESGKYVQDLLLQQKELVISVLKNNGYIFICGSIVMMNATLQLLEQLSTTYLQQNLEHLKSTRRIKTDCY